MNSSRSRQFDAILNKLPPAPQYWVAYSGGIDSHVLLHLLGEWRQQLPGPVSAVHVNHQIHQQSGDWEVHCRAVCEESGIPFHLLYVDGKPRRGESPEAAARTARYRGLADWLPKDALLLTAQHQDDQAETLLLQLFRGAGPRGLAAMPDKTRLGQGWLVRPFLDLKRQAIVDYAHAHRLHWVEDPTNTDTRYDRNLLRQRIVPELRQRWPGISTVLARAAALQSDQVELADALAALDLQHGRLAGSDCLSVSTLGELSPARQRNLIRYWVAGGGLPLPSRVVLERIREEILSSRYDASPLVHWPGAEVRRYRDRLYLMKPLPEHDPDGRLPWDCAESVFLETADGVLTASAVSGQGLRCPGSGAQCEIRFRQGGESLRPAGRAHHHPLKKLFQEWGVPDWERERVPLIYLNDELVAVSGLCVCEGHQPEAGDHGQELHWSRISNWLNTE